MPIYSYRNIETGEVVEWRSNISDRGKFLETVDDPELWSRVPDLMVTSTEKMSTAYIGAVPQKRKDDMRLYREELKLTSKMQSTHHDKREDISKEIKKIQKKRSEG